MRVKTRQIVSCGATLICVALVVLAGPASAVSILNLTGIDTAQFGSITGAVDSTITHSYDFIPEIDGGDGEVTSTVYLGTGDASGLYIYTYSITLYDADIASVGAVVGMTFEFGSTPSAVDGVGDAFFVIGTGDAVPDLAIYDSDNEIAGFRFSPVILNGETTVVVGLFSELAPAETTAQMIDSGATGGTVVVLSNGVPTSTQPVPEPSAALIFALGFVVISARCRKRA